MTEDVDENFIREREQGDSERTNCTRAFEGEQWEGGTTIHGWWLPRMEVQ